MLFIEVGETAFEEMYLYLYLLLLESRSFLFFHDDFEKRTFCKFAVTSVLAALGLVAFSVRASVLFFQK